MMIESSKDVANYVENHFPVRGENIIVAEDPPQIRVVIKERIPDTTVNGIQAELQEKTPRQARIDVECEPFKERMIKPNEESETEENTTRFREGDIVEVQMTTGAVQDAEITNVHDETITEIEVRGRTLWQYWQDKADEELPKDDRVITAKSKETGTELYFPETKVSFHPMGMHKQLPFLQKSTIIRIKHEGYPTVHGLRQAHVGDLAMIQGVSAEDAKKIKKRVDNISKEDLDLSEDAIIAGFICPQCDESFPNHYDDAVEGDEGEMFCSIECLNEHYT